LLEVYRTYDKKGKTVNTIQKYRANIRKALKGHKQRRPKVGLDRTSKHSRSRGKDPCQKNWPDAGAGWRKKKAKAGAGGNIGERCKTGSFDLWGGNRGGVQL